MQYGMDSIVSMSALVGNELLLLLLLLGSLENDRISMAK